jgi:putative nucleotidyltransferase with HDIG domain
MNKIGGIPAWEDIFFIIFAGAWWMFGGGESVLHLYTVGVMALVLSLSLRRGLAAGLMRVVGSYAVLFLGGGMSRHAHPDLWMDILPMLGCGVFAGILGDWQKRAREKLQHGFLRTLEALAQTLEARDPYTEGHSRRTARYAVAIARVLGLDKRTVDTIEQAGLLHDFGKIGTPDAILWKTGPLTPAEEERIRQHPKVGGRILAGIPFLEPAAVLVRQHHERYDGSGYPDGQKGDSIPLGSRILAVADALDALTTDRPYHRALPWSAALQELQRSAGRHFDPTVVQSLARLTPSFV